MESEEDAESTVQEVLILRHHNGAEGTTKMETASRDQTAKQQSLQIKIMIGAAVLPVVYIAALIISADYILHTKKCNSPGCVCVCPVCPDDWIGYREKCYYFSLEKKNWTSSQNFCSSQKGSLLIFSHNREKDFVMRYKGKVPSWIGFRKDPNQIWQWTNGENTMNLEVIGKGGDCAYLNSEGTATASRCSTELFWICSKPNVCKISNGA